MSSDMSGMYKQAREAIGRALGEISAVEIDDDDGGEHLRVVTAKLQQIAARFEEDIEFLDANAEWEAFTIAFFGETNAGKSTIVESLRIIFDEAGRRERIEKNVDQAEALEAEICRDADALASQLRSYGGGLSLQLDEIEDDVKRLLEQSREAGEKAIEVAEQVTSAQARFARTRLWIGLGCGLATGIAAGLGIGAMML